MGERNMMCSGQAIDLDPDQLPHYHLRSEPSVPFGSIPNFPHRNIHTMLPAAGNVSNFDIDFLQSSNENALFSRRVQFNAFQHNHLVNHHDVDISAAYNYYNPCMIPSGSRVMSLPIIQGPEDQLPNPINGGIVGVQMDAHRSNNHFTDSFGDSFKIKTMDGFVGSYQYRNGSVGSSSASYPLPEYRLDDIPSLVEVETYGSVRNGSGVSGADSVLMQNPSHWTQANHPVQAFQNASSPWLDQQFSTRGGGSTSTWNQTSPITYLHGGSANTVSSISPTTFLHRPPTHQGHPHHRLPQPLQGARVQNINAVPQIATSSQRFSINRNPHTGTEVGPRHVGPVLPTGLRIYRPHRRGHMPEATMRHHNLPSLRILPTDEVAMLEVSGYYEIGDPVDRHRDMRLDIDNMSYEELLALGERIGNVASGLSEETILTHLKTRIYISSSTPVNTKEAPCVDQESEFCVICQTDYENQEKIGTLDCGHAYHVDCVKKWLLEKNTCPICKSTGLTTDRED
ncbi:hypothetical protein NMG60_11037024 [Bertholletia excelsa]